MVFLLSIVIWSIKCHRDPKLHIECSSPIGDLIPSLAGLALGSNSIEVLENGAFFDVLLERIRSAQKSMHFETFLILQNPDDAVQGCETCVDMPPP